MHNRFSRVRTHIFLAVVVALFKMCDCSLEIQVLSLKWEIIKWSGLKLCAHTTLTSYHTTRYLFVGFFCVSFDLAASVDYNLRAKIHGFNRHKNALC